MKKLKLQALSLSAKELLSREQMKMVMGGSGSGGSGPCLGCDSDRDCRQVNKGDCKYYESHSAYCCSGWVG